MQTFRLTKSPQPLHKCASAGLKILQPLPCSLAPGQPAFANENSTGSATHLCRGVSAAQAAQLVQKVEQEGKAVVVAGPKAQLDQAAKIFESIKMTSTVRPLTEGDIPSKAGAGGSNAGAPSNSNKPAPGKAPASAASARPGEYADSDVIEASGAELEQYMQGGGTLVAFYAPWCGPCRQMVPHMKKAASLLKAKGITVAAINSDANPGLAQKMGIRGFPSVKWVAAGGTADYKGDRTAMDIVSWAQQQSAISTIKAKVTAVGGAVKRVGKLAMSKVLGAAGGAGSGMVPAQAPAAAAA